MPRGIDHIVVAVRELERAGEAWRRLGFTVSPAANNPFGTLNALVQFDGNFIELLAIADPGTIVAARPGVFPFAGFNRDFLKTREGISMLALHSDDTEADLADFEAHGLQTYEPFAFVRERVGADGVAREVGFSYAFTREPRLREAGFLTSRNKSPDNFWQAAFQSHANGARRIAAVMLVARDPADFHEFVTHFSGQHDMVSTSLGVEFDTGAGTIEIVSPVGYRARFGETSDPDPRRFLGCRIAVADLAATGRLLKGNGVPFAARMDALVVPPTAADGVGLAFVES